MATLFSDNFDRADSDSLGGNWVEGSGDWDILSNKLRCVTQGDLYNTTPLGTANYEVESNWTYDGAGYPGITGRHVDGNNYYQEVIGATTTYLSKRVAGSYTTLGTYASGQLASATYKLSMNGTTIKAYINGVERISADDSAFGDEGDFGCTDTYDNAHDWDNFVVYSFEAGGGLSIPVAMQLRRGQGVS